MRTLNRPIFAIRSVVATNWYAFLIMSAEKTSCNDVHKSLKAFPNPLIASSVSESASRTRRTRKTTMNTDPCADRTNESIPPDPSDEYHFRNKTHSYICLRIAPTFVLYSGSSLCFPRAFTWSRMSSTVVQRSRMRSSRAICWVTIWSCLSTPTQIIEKLKYPLCSI